MSNRTFKIIGAAFAESGDVTVTVTADGTQVFNNTVTTTSGAAPAAGSYTDAYDSELCQFELAIPAADENVTINVVVSGGEAVITGIVSNYEGGHEGNPATTFVSVFDGDGVTQTLRNSSINSVSSNASSAEGEVHHIMEAGDTLAATITNSAKLVSI
jgi:hypothetical protein